MDIQLEKTFLIDALQDIQDIAVIQRVKNFLNHEINMIALTPHQKSILDQRLLAHKNNTDSGIDAFAFLDNLQTKYELKTHVKNHGFCRN